MPATIEEGIVDPTPRNAGRRDLGLGHLDFLVRSTDVVPRSNKEQTPWSEEHHNLINCSAKGETDQLKDRHDAA